MNRLTNYLLLSIPLLFSFGCSRDVASHQLTVKLPTKQQIMKTKGFSALSITPAGFKACFAANVVGAGIATHASACGPNKGVSTPSFHEEGTTISLQVPTGSSRTVEVYMYTLSNTTAQCPAWNFDCTTSNNCSVFKVGVTENVEVKEGVENQAEVTVSFPGWESHVAVSTPLSCSEGVRGVLYSNGDIIDSSDDLPFNPNYSSQLIDSFYTLSSGAPAVHYSGGLSSENLTVTYPSHIRSITMSPDTQLLYGIIGNGTIVGLAAATGTILDISANCPFETCVAPPWIQSISAGSSGKIYGLDHGGNIYRMGAAGVMTQETATVSHRVTQVSYF